MSIFKTGILLSMIFLTSTVQAQKSHTAVASVSANIETGGGLNSNTNSLPFGKGFSRINTSRIITFDPVCIPHQSELRKPNSSIEIGTLASMTVNGQAGYAFTITLPDCVDFDGPNNDKITINSFAAHPAVSCFINTEGIQNIRISADLKIPYYQSTGSYINVTPVIITVNYY